MAAFLTVERQQNTVKSLEELNRQSKITYTVLRDSPYLEYFQVSHPSLPLPVFEFLYCGDVRT